MASQVTTNYKWTLVSQFRCYRRHISSSNACIVSLHLNTYVF